jgi:hypothetical protein
VTGTGTLSEMPVESIKVRLSWQKFQRRFSQSSSPV